MAPPTSTWPWFSSVSDEPRGDHVLTCTTGHSPQINAFEGYCHPVAMLEYEIGDRVWIDIPDEIDPDHGRYHAERGRIVNISEGEVDTLTGGDRDSIIYRVQFSTGEEMDIQHQLISPPMQ